MMNSYLAAWVRLLTRTPAELEQERQPSPRMPGSRKGAKDALQSTQGAGVGQPYRSDRRDEYEH